MQQITKTFAGVVANDGVTLTVQASEIHALLGENGAGKSTLMHVLYGLYQPEAGDILLQGRPVRLRSPRDAMAQGIGLVAQHPLLVRRATVAENIALGLPGTPFWRPLRSVEARIRDLGERYDLVVAPRAAIWQLSAGEQQRVAILKALMHQARILILDEPTAVLTPPEIRRLFETLQQMKAAGHAIILITHKLAEVMAVADRITVLRHGRVAATMPRTAVEAQTLAGLMFGVEATSAPEHVPERPTPAPARTQRRDVMVRVEHLRVHNDHRQLALRGISFTLQRGEILGVAGVAGNGQRELVEVLTGLRQAVGGRAHIMVPRTAETPGTAAARVAHIPEERQRVGLVSALSVAENFVLRQYRQPPFRRGLFLQRRTMHRQAQQAMHDYGIVAPDVTTPAGLLSGGNMQRLILAREFFGQPQVIIASHPTYGLDAAATAHIQRLLLQQRDQGAAILLVSEDVEELLLVSDRLMVLCGGEIMGMLPTTLVDRQRLGLLMTGVRAL